MNIFLICPVREATDEQTAKMAAYVSGLEMQGNKVHWPGRGDTVQEGDPTGFRICTDNMKAIAQADEVHIFWDPTSHGTKFDLGMAFSMGKSLKIVNPDSVEKTEKKSFANMILDWSTKGKLQ